MLRTPTAAEVEGGPVSPEVAKAKGQTLRLTGQVLAMLPTVLANSPMRTSRRAMLTKEGGRAHVSLNQAVELAQGELPREFESWDEVPESVRPAMLPTPTVADTFTDNMKSSQQKEGSMHSVNLSRAVHMKWGKFEPAVSRWEGVLGRPAPEPTLPDGQKGQHRLSSRFTEWMMGLDDGWITGHGLHRKDEIKMAGNGVVPQQAEYALKILLNRLGD